MMYLSGIDLVEINRIKKAALKPSFLSRVFSEREISLFAQKNYSAQTIAANFCAKEAFAKAIGTGFRGFCLNEVEALRDELGAPYLVFSGKALALVQKRNLAFSLSLTHTREFAAAMVVGWENKHGASNDEKERDNL